VNGRFQADDGSSLCEYTARLHFYAGKPYVRLQLTVTNREDMPLSSGLAVYPLLLRDLSVSLPLGLRGGMSFAITGRRGYGTSHRGELAGATDSALLVQYPARAERLGRYVVLHGEKRVATGRAAGGGIGLWDASQGAIVCVRHLWANNPKALRATGLGRIEAGLFPEEAGPVDDFVAGRAKTHDLLLLFHGSDLPSPVDVSAAFDSPPTACVAAGPEGAYRGVWASNALGGHLAPLTGSPYDLHFRGDFEELLRTQETTGSYGMWNHGAQGVYRQRIIEFIVRRADLGSLQSRSLVGLRGAIGMAIAGDTGRATDLGRPEPLIVSSADPESGTISFVRTLDPVPARGAQAVLYDPNGVFLSHRYDVGYALAREFLRRGDPVLLYRAHDVARHLVDVTTFHGIRGQSAEWVGACQDGALGHTAHHVPGLSREASWYAGAWLTFLLTGDRALLRNALENAEFATRHAGRDGMTVQAAALAVMNLCYAADVASALSPADARAFERALRACVDRLFVLQGQTRHGLYGERVIEAALAFEALDLSRRRRRDPRIDASLERAGRALIRPGVFWSAHAKAGRLKDDAGRLFKPYGLADGLVVDRLANPDGAVYGTVCQLVVPHLASVSEISGDTAFIKKARRLERVATLFRCSGFDDFALRYRAGDRFAAQWQAYLEANPPVEHDAITFQCRMENSADVALPDFGTGGSIIGMRFVPLPDGSRACEIQAPDLATREGLGVWFPMAEADLGLEKQGAIEFRICYREGPAPRAEPWLLCGNPALHGFHFRPRTDGIEFLSRSTGRLPNRLVARGVAVHKGAWHHVAVRWWPAIGTELLFDGEVVAKSDIDRVGFGPRLLFVCDADDKKNVILVDDLRIWHKPPKMFAGAADRTPPAAITDLRFKRMDGGRLQLMWTAPGNDGSKGQASRYDIRVSTQGFHPISWGGYPDLQDPVAAIHWAEAERVQGVPKPKPAGQIERLLVGPFPEDRRVYIAVRTEDDANVSPLSNVVRTPVNHPPVPYIGPAVRQVITGTTAVFHAGGSTDPDYDDLTYAWSTGARGIATEAACAAPGRQTVTLEVADGSATRSAQTTVVVGDSVRVSFQPHGHATPGGFVVCCGQPYTRSRGSGWVSYAASPVPFARGEPVDLPVYARTGLRLPRSAEWRLDVPNGTYRLTLAVGDPARLKGRQHVFAEGKPLFEVELGTRSEPYVARDLEVAVADGQLNLHIGGPGGKGESAGPGGELNYIIVQRAR
jgi:hypothetical protein